MEAARLLARGQRALADGEAHAQTRVLNKLTHFFHSSIRGRLTLLVAALTVPAVLLVASMMVQAYRNEQQSTSAHLAMTARALAFLVDRQLGESEALLQGLATSQELREGNFAGFDARARAATLDEDRWIVLLDAEGQVLVNTRLARDEPLPKTVFDGEPLAAAQQGRTFISNVEVGAQSRLLRLYVAYPILENGRLKYVLRIVMAPTTFSQSLEMVTIARRNIAAVIDRAGTLAARSRDGQKFVGKKATPDLLAALNERSEGVRESRTLEGIPVLMSYYRSPTSGWTGIIAAPREDLYRSVQRLLWLGLGLSAVLILVATFIVMWIGRAVVHSVESLVADTESVAHGGTLSGGANLLAETAFVSRAMARTVSQLAEQQQANAALNHALEKELEQQKRAEEASRTLAGIVELSTDGIISKDLDGRITSWNQGAERIFGFRADEIIGQPITRLLQPTRPNEEPEILDRIQRGERIEHYETVRVRKDGSLVDLSLTVSRVSDRDGRIVGVSTIARDISKRKMAEQQQQALFELVASVNRAEALHEIYNLALDAICRSQSADRAAVLVTDGQGVMRFTASRGLSESYRHAVEGHSPWDREATNFRSLTISDVSAASLEAPILAAIEAEGIAALAFIPLMDKKRLLGKFVVYYNRPHAFELHELRPAETIASQVAFAIERQKGAEALEALVDERTASLRQAIGQMQEFSYSVSHDLRSPVRAMRGYADALIEDYGDQIDAEGRELLARIRRNGERMDRLIQDLLTYSRISQRQLVLEPVSLARLIPEIVQQYPEMQPDQADIEIESLDVVIAHEPSLAQVVSNLLANAIKFVSPGRRPSIRIWSERRENRVRVWFEDKGIGIKPEHQSRLFAMFERINPDKQYEGTGIGLAIVRKAVERMNGTVGVVSDGVTGSAFWIELQAATP